jgi:hypothetical protein
MNLTKNKQMRRLGGLLAVDAVLFGSTRAAEVPSFMVIAAFLLLSLTFYYMIYGLVGLSGLYGLPIKRQRPTALYITGVLSILIALQSVGELGARDIWVLLPLAFMGYFYNAYAKADRL